MVANAGKNKQVTFTVMPEKARELNIKADVVDFRITGHGNSCCSTIDAPDMDDITGEIEMKSLTDAIREISNSVGELNNGVSELNSGIASLRDGSEQYQKGILDINGASSGLFDASLSIDEDLTTISKSLSGNSGDMDLCALKELPGGLSQIADGLRQTANGLAKLNENYAVAYSSLNDAMMAIPDYEITEEEIQGLYMRGANSDVVDQLVETYTAARTAKGTYSAVKEVFDAVEPTLNQVDGVGYRNGKNDGD